MRDQVTLTRRVSFSSGHRYWIASLGEEQNRALFGKWASPFSHGHNYVLDVSVVGSVDRSTGMVINIKALDAVLQANVVADLDQTSINDQVPEFSDKAPSLENLLLYLAARIARSLPPQTKLLALRLEESPLLYGEWENGKLTLTRSYEFAASHRLNSPDLTPEQNVELYGKCNNPAGHGHNYVLEVTVQGSPDPKTGMMLPIDEMDHMVEKLVIDRYDHRHLNVDLDEYKNVPAPSEVVAQHIFEALDGKLPAKLKRIRLQETARNVFEVSAPE